MIQPQRNPETTNLEINTIAGCVAALNAAGLSGKKLGLKPGVKICESNCADPGTGIPLSPVFVRPDNIAYLRTKEVYIVGDIGIMDSLSAPVHLFDYYDQLILTSQNTDGHYIRVSDILAAPKMDTQIVDEV